MPKHLTREFLYQIGTGVRQASDLAEAALAHLLELCPACRRAVEEWGDETAPRSCGESYPEHSSSPDGPNEASTRIDAILRRPELEWLPSLRQEVRSHTAGSFAEELLKRARDFLPGKPAQTRTLAALAGILLRHAGSTSSSTPLYALSLAHQANASRVEENLGHAQELMETARFVLRIEQCERESDPVLLSEIDWLEGSLRRSQRRFAEAERLFLRSARTCFEAGLESEAAQRLLSLGNVYSLQGAPARKDRVIRRACEMLQRDDSHPKLILMGLHNRVHLLAKWSRPLEARHLFSRIHDLYVEVDEPGVRLRKPWAEGLILQQEGSLRRAEDRLQEARTGFGSRGLRYTSAMVAKDLAILYVQQRRLRDLEATIDEIIPVFETKGVQYEVDAARKILRDALGSRREVN